jgi:hypothetical protein
MPFTQTRLVCAMLLCMATMTPCRADSSTSSASSAGSASSGSLSDSIHGSSTSSTGTQQVAEGDYRIVEVAALAGHPRLVRLKLQASARPGEGSEFFLDLPRHTLARAGLAPHDMVSVRQRPYGFEFARADSRDAFFLVLLDDWHGELEPRAVTL